jgi:hypothetical protein
MSVGIVTSLIIYFFRKSNKKVKTPWFEIAPDSVNAPETEDMGKTRLLLKRQFEYVDNYINGISNTFLALEKCIVDDAMKILFKNESIPKTHMQTCLINSNTNELIQLLKNYLNGLLVINHIGSNKDKIKRYAKSHVCQVVAIAKKHSCDIFCKLSGNICTDSVKYWKEIGIEDPNSWAEHHLTELLLGLSELRYSDFDTTNDKEEE